jgi:hypothetical protein
MGEKTDWDLLQRQTREAIGLHNQYALHPPVSLVARLAAALADASRDSQRLDWMEQNKAWATHGVSTSDGVARWAVDPTTHPAPVMHGDSLRAAIDMASSTHPLGGDDR